MGFSQKGPKFDGKTSLNRTAHTLKEKDVKSSVFLKKARFTKQNAWENIRQTRSLRGDPRDFWRLGRHFWAARPFPTHGEKAV